MLLTAFILFAVAAVGGLTIATLSFKGRPIPWALTLGHGALGATGLVLLIVALLMGSAPAMIKWVLAILIVAALGGFYLLSFHLRKERHPRPFILIHALLAATGVVLLLWTLLPQSA